MRVLLRNTETGHYYQGQSKWTPDQEEAHDLEALPRAVKLAVEAHLENVEVLLCFDDPRFNLVLPISSAQAKTDSPRSHDLARPLQKKHERQGQ